MDPQSKISEGLDKALATCFSLLMIIFPNYVARSVMKVNISFPGGLVFIISSV